jgi:hypothetical protein
MVAPAKPGSEKKKTANWPSSRLLVVVPAAHHFASCFPNSTLLGDAPLFTL